MSLPDPVPGLVIRCSCLWKTEYGRGQEEGVKDRPCAVILVSVDDGGDRVVTVLPISHAPPADPGLAVELPAATKRRLGLDDERFWVVLTEANRFPAQALLAPNPTGESTLRRKGPGSRPAAGSPRGRYKRCLWIAAVWAVRNHPAAILPRPDPLQNQV